jgi:hypothetical protein
MRPAHDIDLAEHALGANGPATVAAKVIQVVCNIDNQGRFEFVAEFLKRKQVRGKGSLTSPFKLV